MELSEFNYYLPEELIAQTPIDKRDESRLMVLDRKTGEIEHKVVKDIIDYLEPGDCLVRNNTKVLPARLYGKKETGFGNTESMEAAEYSESDFSFHVSHHPFGCGSFDEYCIQNFYRSHRTELPGILPVHA